MTLSRSSSAGHRRRAKPPGRMGPPFVMGLARSLARSLSLSLSLALYVQYLSKYLSIYRLYIYIYMLWKAGPTNGLLEWSKLAVERDAQRNRRICVKAGLLSI